MEQPYMLFVDDDPDEVFIAQEIFTDYGIGHLMHSARNGNEVIVFLEKALQGGTLPRILVMDINMPIMDGIEALKKINLSGRFHEVEIIMHSNDNTQVTIDRCRQSGANGYIVKSLNNEKLKAVVKRLREISLRS